MRLLHYAYSPVIFLRCMFSKKVFTCAGREWYPQPCLLLAYSTYLRGAGRCNLLGDARQLLSRGVRLALELGEQLVVHLAWHEGELGAS